MSDQRTMMRRYHAERAAEYEAVYARPERQADLAALRARLQELLAGQDVLEIACGTGYWTQAIAATARSMLATDITEPMLTIARHKPDPASRVCFAEADAFRLDDLPGPFTAAFAGKRQARLVDVPDRPGLPWPDCRFPRCMILAFVKPPASWSHHIK